MSSWQDRTIWFFSPELCHLHKYTVEINQQCYHEVWQKQLFVGVSHKQPGKVLLSSLISYRKHTNFQVQKYNGSIWAANRPDSLTESFELGCDSWTKLMEKEREVTLCQANKQVRSVQDHCRYYKHCTKLFRTKVWWTMLRNEEMDIGILSKKFGYPVDFMDWRDFVDPSKMKILDLQKQWNTFAVHLWNNMAKNNEYDIRKHLDQNKQVPLTKLFQRNCPVFHTIVNTQNTIQKATKMG